ncbi:MULTISPECIES: LamB/YcsF family protein [unclassified Clostridioides]|uniref:LamB/YcsF family protein n=1 Tax=unclassified Clostridioides TaxID=2635829 RepID=UPI001D0C5F6C|nr:LamB/YcsF family protein [Clostridioides sp. ES-S-0001-02]MCC0640343.1 LamB/YcsF family protein [Clostridioides sp. ES-S-0049-03]MCC0651876.1 LamB/YcsF family protein [Clostridioides sp. ES-S-0001-03]MCC0657679.1 LamB/YcsF family protein [Clostridioides sp. ES-S-0123-01]MCC0671150.1 LamB/YcsF family protein [Clostridioides sp. ES-S-0145-01]MCC0676988.1 LamB/YcsF family protein [Clostridioides sp. ES-W-0018-02]MCC0678956.1 LamB/YcsF family protein [Clostridioides sp. ES-S-0005-03]MCC069425
MYKVDLNSDLGESFGTYKIGLDEEVLKYISSANIACGFHAGDPSHMDKTVKLAKENGVKIGAHPGFLDLIGFGRREMKITKQEAKDYTKYQLGALMAFATSNECNIQHVKPHGALYNMAAKDKNLAMAICEAIYEVNKDITLLGLYNSEMINSAKEVGLKFANEVFADRAYDSNGFLVPRNVEGAVIHDTKTAIDRVVKMVKEGTVETITGEIIHIKADSICVHGDNPKAIEFVKEIRKRFELESIEVCPLENMEVCSSEDTL